MALQYSPKIVQDSLVMCLDASQNKSYPTDLPVKNGLALWLDAADDTTFSYSSGTSVSQWRDKSGNNRHFFQATAGNQPSRSAVINSRKAIQFTAASSQYLRYNSTIINNTTGGSVFVVWRTAGETQAYSSILDNYHCGNNALSAGFQIERNVTNNQYYWGFVTTGCANAGFMPATSYSNDTTNCIWITKDSTTITGGLNGTSGTPNASPSATWVEDTKGWTIGTWGLGIESFDRFFNGQQCEVIIFNRGLSDTERKQVNTYLGQKWGISNTDRSIVDLSNNNNNGSFGGAAGSQNVANMPDYDFYNKGAFKFNGTSDFIQYPSLLNLGNVFTINFWIKPTSNTRQTIISNGYPYLANKGFFLTCPGNSSTDMFLSLGNDQKQVQSNTGAITTGVAQMVTAVANGAGGLMKLYVNGSEVSYAVQQNADISLQYDSGIFVTGKRDTTTSDYLSSNLYALQIYNRALSAAEVLQNYEAQKSKFANTIVQQGLVLNLDAGNIYSYAGAGTVWYDVSGNNYSGSLTNGPTYSSDVGGVIVFDGSNDYVVSSNFTPNFSTKTLSGWVKLSSISQQGGGLITLQSTDGTVFDSIVYNETGQGWGFGSNGFSRTGWSGVLETSTSDWVNITATYENSNYRLYRNGVLIQTLTSFGALNFNFNSNVQLGYRHLGSSGYLSATIAQGIIYNRVLSASEVLQNYNATKGRFGL